MFEWKIKNSKQLYMEKEAKVILLPSENITSIGKPIGKLEYDKDGFDPHIVQTFEMYIVTDDEIKEGDWIFDNYSKNVIQAKLKNWGKDDIAKKIIATTDKSLNNNNSKEYKNIRELRNRLRDKYEESASFREGNIIKERIKKIDFDLSKWEKSLPQIPQSFIEEYVKAGGIDEVYLEYEKININNSLEPYARYDYEIKTDQNNCVIIHSIEPKFYTLEELTNAFNSAREFNSKDGVVDIHIIADLPKDLSPKYSTVGDWIKENL